jgi:hypothetical protein
MKKVFFALVLTLAGQPLIAQEFQGNRLQIVIEQHAAHTTIKTDSLTVEQVKEFFNFTDELFTGKSKIYDRYLYTNREIYYRAGAGLFGRKPTIYKKVNGNYVKIKS